MKHFTIDPELEKNSFFVTDLELSKVYVKNDKENPWFVLIPKKAHATELMDLTHEEQCILMEEITMVSDFLKNFYKPSKLNVGTLGNMVRQLHIHVIARYENDRAWPQALWGTTPSQIFEEVELENIRSNFQDFTE